MCWDKFDMAKRKDVNLSHVVISMHGLVTTFISLLLEDIRVQHKVPVGLPALMERRPVFKLLFTLDEANLSGQGGAMT
jgi:hypothetical protein